MKRGRMKFRGEQRSQTSDTTDKYDIGDILIVKILSADRLNSPELTTVGKYLGRRNRL